MRLAAKVGLSLRAPLATLVALVQLCSCSSRIDDATAVLRTRGGETQIVVTIPRDFADVVTTQGREIYLGVGPCGSADDYFYFDGVQSHNVTAIGSVELVSYRLSRPAPTIRHRCAIMKTVAMLPTQSYRTGQLPLP